MTAAEQLALYRSRHVIKPSPPGPGPYHCLHCKVDIIQRYSGRRPLLWRHDPDEIQRLVKEAAEELVKPFDAALEESAESIMKREPWQRELMVIHEREHWGFRLYTEVADLIRQAVRTAREEARR